MGKHLFRAGHLIPSFVVSLLTSEEPGSLIAQRLSVSESAVRLWRRAVRAGELVQEEKGWRLPARGNVRRGRSEQTRTARRKKASSKEDWEANSRTMEVLSRPPTAYTLVELVRESPRGACVVCWRDVRSSETLACTRKRPGSTTPCNAYVQRARKAAEQAQEAAKQSLLGEVCHG
jgi:hypothetical protein